MKTTALIITHIDKAMNEAFRDLEAMFTIYFHNKERDLAGLILTSLYKVNGAEVM